LREAAVFGSKAWGATLLQLVNYRLDLFLLAAFVSRADVGRYSVALSVTALAWLLPSALETVIFPRTADLHAAQGRGEIELEESDRATARAVRHSVVLLIPAALLVLLLVVVAVPLLYGPEFMRSVWFGMILIPGVVSLSLGKTLSAVITGRGHPQVALWITAITVPLTIVLYVALIPPFGAFGAAVGSTLSYLSSTALALFWFRRKTHIPLRSALVPSRAELRDYVDALGNVRRRLRPRAT
jgi:O-antigen/teichoic acid export membrane protein